MANTVLVGAQWGDEGKGKVIDYLTDRVDVVVRSQGGNNAGHTVVVGDVKYETGKNRGYAAFASNVCCIPGYQRDSVERHSLFKTRVRTCSKRWAPGSVHRICCFFTIRLLTT
jgi:hypothetical protein